MAKKKSDKLILRFDLRIKECDKVFHEGWPPGVIAQQEVEYTVSEEDRKSPRFAAAVLEQQDQFIENNVEVDINEVD